MDDRVSTLLELCKTTATNACRLLCSFQGEGFRKSSIVDSVPREVKAVADMVMEKEIISSLKPAGLPIVSEESGEIPGDTTTGMRFVVDPLDGTVNYIRKLGLAAVSIALFKADRPIFGVLAQYPNENLAWGGEEIGAFLDDRPITVSSISEISKSVVCTGFPSRFNTNDQTSMLPFLNMVASFQKVRMFGAASVSLLKVASGAAELYAERDIMLWDVAAGLAILEGAGGTFSLSSGSEPFAVNVLAGNGCVELKDNWL
jgi:myo-inositol-1(or 4)-monophosphatase